MTVNEQIKVMREKQGLSQKQLAEKVKKINQSQISKIESGKRKISVDELISLSVALETSLNVIIGKEET